MKMSVPDLSHHSPEDPDSHHFSNPLEADVMRLDEESAERLEDAERVEDARYGVSKVEVYDREFGKAVDSLLVLPPQELETHRLGGGRQGSVYRLDTPEGGFAVKIGGVDVDMIRAFRRGEAIQDLTHLEGVDAANTRAVMDVLEGTVAHDLSYEQRISVPEKAYSRLVSTVLDMTDVGLEIDANPGNFIYDPETDVWRIVDYRLAKHDTRATQVMRLAEMLIRYVPWDVPDPALHVPYGTELSQANIEAQIRRQREDVTILERFLDVLERDFPAILAEAADDQTEVRQRGGASIFYNTRSLPADDPQYDSFKDRLGRLGLLGTELDPPPPPSELLDDDVLD